eukprot:225358_1
MYTSDIRMIVCAQAYTCMIYRSMTHHTSLLSVHFSLCATMNGVGAGANGDINMSLFVFWLYSTEIVLVKSFQMQCQLPMLCVVCIVLYHQSNRHHLIRRHWAIHVGHLIYFHLTPTSFGALFFSAVMRAT